MNLRNMIDGQQALATGRGNRPKTSFKQGDQVVVRKDQGFGKQATTEVMVGTIAAFGQNGQSAVVSIPRPGGKQLRSTVPLSKLSSVTEVFRRNRVQFNPAFRGSV